VASRHPHSIRFPSATALLEKKWLVPAWLLDSEKSQPLVPMGTLAPNCPVATVTGHVSSEISRLPDWCYRSRSFQWLGINPLTQHSNGHNDLDTNDASGTCSFSHGVPRDSHPGGCFADESLLPW
jgi:hypothetical protein